MHPRASALIRELSLEPHPEGGHYRRIHTSSNNILVDGRPRAAETAIAFLLGAGECSRWHRIDADETWHWQEGDSLELLCFDAQAGTLSKTVLGDPLRSRRAMHVVPAGTWQSARSLGGYVLVACAVSPGFKWAGFELLDDNGEVAEELSRLGALHAPGFKKDED